MTPAARLAAAIEILDDIVAGDPAERALTRWARRSRFAGSKDRAAVRDVVFDVLRRRRSALWASGAVAETGRALVIGALALTTPEALAQFGEGPHGPEPVAPAERNALRGLEDAPQAVQLDVPNFMYDLLIAQGIDLAEVAALRARAPVDLRVNSLRGNVERAQKALLADGIDTMPVAGVPGALRVLRNPRKVAGSAAYAKGLVELQDAASQLVALALDPSAGDKVLDLCAGGGGKTLALAAAMGGGPVFAHDINPGRMRDLPVRAARAGADVQVILPQDLDDMSAQFDRVLVDAPCSGTGAFRRNPDQKWRLTPETLRDLQVTQAAVLDRAVRLTKAGGSLVYATCSILCTENEHQVAAALSRWPNTRKEDEHRLAPGGVGDGFYICKILIN